MKPSSLQVKRQLRLATTLLLVLFATASLHAQITPAQDAYTSTASPTKNFGTATTLGVESSETTYIQFNLSSIPAGYTGEDIAKATLKLYVNSVTTAGNFNVDYVNGTWSEATIDANDAPALGTTIAASVPLTTADKNQYILVDITSAVQAWLNGTTNDGIALVGNSPVNATFDSKENTTTSHAAELDIVFAGGNGTITGINTAVGSGLTGGGTSGTLNLSLITTCKSGQVLSWNGSAWVCTTAKGTGTVTSVGSGTGLTGGPITTSGTLSVDTTKVPLLSAGNVFSGNNSFAGTVGIGTTSPTHMLEVNVPGATVAKAAVVSSGSDAAFSLKNTGSGGHEYWIDSGSGTAGVGPGNFAVWDATAGAARFAINPGGEVGIGTTTPVGGLEVHSQVASTTGVLGYGANASSGSALFGGDGLDAYGGNGDPSGEDSGGFGVVGYGGTGGEENGFFGGDGLGGYFQGGTGTVFGDGVDAVAGSGYAGSFVGNLTVSGAITAGTKDFKIDHPLDPANKYLVHASVESSEMMNIYTGNVTTDQQGNATVKLPDWFEALNADFRYQLTVIGQFAQAIIAHKIGNNQFSIQTSAPSVEVSWQVTGVRQDAFAKAHPLVVEQEKDAPLKGFFIHPELYGAPPQKQIEWARHPRMMKETKERRDGRPVIAPALPRTRAADSAKPAATTQPVTSHQ